MTTRTYYVGDLAYVFTDKEWDRYCAVFDQPNVPDEDGIFDCENCLDPEAFSWEEDGLDRPYFYFNTAYGDGVYEDKEGKRYSVDSGSIGAICVDHIKDQEKLRSAVERGLGHLHQFSEDFAGSWCGYDNGVIYFDGVEIDTAGDFLDEEEEEEE